MLEVALIGACCVGCSMVITVLFYNVRRSRCVRCDGCGCHIERQVMTEQEMTNDKLELPNAL